MGEKTGVVSLWIGNVKKAADLKQYLMFKYNRDGDALPSGFTKAFKIDWYDEDLQEAEKLKKSSKMLRELLSGFSYEDIIVPRFIELYGELVNTESNAIILLYNFEYEGSVKRAKTGDVEFQFIGTVSYKK